MCIPITNEYSHHLPMQTFRLKWGFLMYRPYLFQDA
ncbi:hypothetical protein PAAL109150_26850 [Paenibacillus alkaliterrae]